MNHIQLGSMNVAAARLFYETYFGFRLELVEDEITFLRSENGFLLALRGVQELPAFPSWFHIGLCCDTPDTVRRLYMRMKSEHVRFVRDFHEGADWVAFYCLDPDGYSVEVSWDRPRPST